MEELGRWTDEDRGKNVSARRGEERVKRGDGRGEGHEDVEGTGGEQAVGCGGTGEEPCKRGSWDGGKVRRERDSES